MDLAGGPIQINVEEHLSIGLEAEVVAVNADSNETIIIYTNQTDTLHIHAFAGVTGTFVAPPAPIVVGDSAEVDGRLLGKTVALTRGAAVYMPAEPEPVAIAPAPEIPVVADSADFFSNLEGSMYPWEISPAWALAKVSPQAPPAYGAIGDAEREFAQMMNMEWYALYGNHINDALGNPATSLTSLLDSLDPPPGIDVVRKVGTFEHRNDGFRYG
jgi:hypothetical protein